MKNLAAELNLPFDLRIEPVEAFCHKWAVRKLEFFGSVWRSDFNHESDIDVLVTFDPDQIPGLYEFIQMNDELKAIFGRDVDLLTRSSVETSNNRFRR